MMKKSIKALGKSLYVAISLGCSLSFFYSCDHKTIYEYPYKEWTQDEATEWATNYKEELADIYIKDCGNVFSPDDIRDLLTTIGYNGMNIGTYIPAGQVIEKVVRPKMIEQAIKNNNKNAVLMHGAPACGKSTALRNNPEVKEKSDSAGIVFDEAFTKLAKLESTVDELLKEGFQVTIISIYNDAVTTFENSMKRGINSYLNDDAVQRFVYMRSYTGGEFASYQGRIDSINKKYGERVTQIYLDNKGNNGGKIVEIDDAKKWDYNVNDSVKMALRAKFDEYAATGKLTPEQQEVVKVGYND